MNVQMSVKSKTMAGAVRRAISHGAGALLAASVLFSGQIQASVSPSGSWVTGLSNGSVSRSADPSQALVLVVHAEHASAITLNSVTYGGIAMTKVVERGEVSGYSAYTAAFVLTAEQLSKATDTNFVPSWSATPTRQPAYASIFLSNVDQQFPVGASAANGASGATTVSTSGVATTAGDYVVVAGTSGNTGTYTVNNAFTETLEHTIVSADGVVGYKMADGSSEVGSITHTSSLRQSVIAFAVQGAVGAPAANANRFEVNMTYDGMGRLATLTHPSSNAAIARPQQAFTYNDMVGNDTVSYNGQQVVTGSTYNNKGLLDRVNVVSPVGGSAYQDYSYDDLGRVSSLTTHVNGVNRYRAHTYRYDGKGFVDTYVRADSGLNNGSSTTIDYGYGSHGELKTYKVGNSTVTYNYDAGGNLTSHNAMSANGLSLPGLSSQTFGSDNRHTNWSYDDAGRVIADDHLAYTYNNLEQIETVKDPGADKVLAHYLYDGASKRVREVVDDKVIYSIRSLGGQLISQEIHQTQQDGSMKITRKDYVFHNGQSMLEVTRDSSGEVDRQYQFRDRQGHPALTMAQSDGYEYRYREYSPYGSQMKSTVGNAPGLEYTGHERDEVSGLDYMKMRYYNSEFAHFLKPDPAFDHSVVNPYSFNLYGYAQANPVNRWDPTGLMTETTVETLENLAVDLQVDGKPVRAHLTLAGAILVEFFAGSIGELTVKIVDGEPVGVKDVAMAALEATPAGKGAKGGKAVLGTAEEGLSLFARIKRAILGSKPPKKGKSPKGRRTGSSQAELEKELALIDANIQRLQKQADKLQKNADPRYREVADKLREVRERRGTVYDDLEDIYRSQE